MGLSSCPTCLPTQPDGCYCVQDWSVLGAQALKAKNVNTYVVGFGSAVNFKALNQTADAGGTALAGCDPNANVASCYYQAQNPSELKSAFGTIVNQVVAEPCTGDCGIPGTRTCTLTGWSACDAPTSQPCTSSCNTVGTQDCVNGALTQCSSEVDCNTGGQGGGGGAPDAGLGGSAATGGSSATGGVDSGPPAVRRAPAWVVTGNLKTPATTAAAAAARQAARLPSERPSAAHFWAWPCSFGVAVPRAEPGRDQLPY